MKMNSRSSETGDNIHMRIPRCQQHRSRLDGSTVNRLHDTHLAQAVQAFGQGTGKEFWHVLHNQDWHRQVSRQVRQQGLQRRRPPGRDADDNSLNHWLRHACAAACRGPSQHRRSCLPSSVITGQCGNLGKKLAYQKIKRRSKVFLLSGFHHIVFRPHCESVQGRACPAFRMCAAHNNRQRRRHGLQSFQNCKTIHARHLKIKQEHIRTKARHCFDSFQPIVRHAA